MTRCCSEVVGISKHLVWCCIFGKCQNLDGSNEMYYAATIQFSKNVQFVHCNYHNIKPDMPINVYTRFCLNTAKSKFSLISPVADW